MSISRTPGLECGKFTRSIDAKMLFAKTVNDSLAPINPRQMMKSEDSLIRYKSSHSTVAQSLISRGEVCLSQASFASSSHLVISTVCSSVNMFFDLSIHSKSFSS
jgi:hypothetical protein